MSLINREDLLQTLGITDMDCEKCGWYSRTARRCKRGSDFEDACCAIDDAPEVKPEPKWIPVSERLPEKPFGCLVTVWDTNPITMDEFENILPYFVGWDGEQWNDCDGEQCPFEVIAWIPLPEVYREEGD